MEGDNEENEPQDDAWLPLETATKRALTRSEKEQIERADDGRGSQNDEQKAEQHGEYVEHYLREVAAFEQRACGFGMKRFRRK